VEFYNKLNANERMVAIGAAVVVVSWLVGVVSGWGFGIGILPLLAAIGVVVVYYLKYAPNQSVNWPAPIPLIVLGIAGVAALLAVLYALQWLTAIGLFGFGLFTLAILGTAVGAVVMAWFAWQEYQAMPKTTPPDSNPPAA
jgi:hypothetical protein